MAYHIFIDNEIIKGCGEAKLVGENVINYEVDEKFYQEFQQNPSKYIWDIETQEPVIDPEYEAKIIAERQQQFNKDFFYTSLGWIRRKVTMATGETKDFLSDLLPTISMGVQMGQSVTIITYKEPDFTQENIDWVSLQENKEVTSGFIQECFLQLSNDFKPIA